VTVEVAGWVLVAIACLVAFVFGLVTVRIIW
jgi:hypothetical protein